MLDPLLYLFHNHAPYELIQTFRCVCTSFVTDDNFWSKFYNRTHLHTIFDEDIVECSHLLVNETYDTYFYQSLLGVAKDRILKRRGLCVGNRSRTGPYGQIGPRGAMSTQQLTDFYSNESNLIRAINETKSKRILERLLTEGYISTEAVDRVRSY